MSQSSKQLSKSSTNINKPAKTYKSVQKTTGPWIIIGICFLLGVADMIFLRGAMASLFKFSISSASMLALILATVANFTAFMWGKATGENNELKSINKHSVSSFLLWAIIGVCYFMIRIMTLMQSINEGTTAANFSAYVGEIVQMAILAVLYIGTGITISAESQKIFDNRDNEYRRRKSAFYKQHLELSDSAADLQENIGKLKGYHRNYDALSLQYDKIKQSIRKAEAASMADVVGKTLKAHPEITPSEAHDVINEMLRRRDNTK